MHYGSTYRPRQSRKSSGPLAYLTPFLIVICIGLIGILLVNLWGAVYDTGPKKAAFLHIVDGSAKMRTWGTEDFFELKSGSLLIQGDELMTSTDAKIIVEFFDGTIMRVNGGTGLVFEEIDAEGEVPGISVILKDGKVWFNKLYKNTYSTLIDVKMDYVTVRSTAGSIFEIENSAEEIARVISGAQIQVDVLSKDNTKIVETEQVGVGQEVVFSDTVLARFWNYQSPTILAALSDEFKSSNWYKWNVSEDKVPLELETDTVVTPDANGLIPVNPEVFEGEDLGEDAGVSGDEIPFEDEVVSDEADVTITNDATVSDSLNSPVIISVAYVNQTNADGFYEVSSRVATLRGTVSGADKIIVNDYTLKEFKPGDTEWAYHANADFDLMHEGENTYEVYAVDSQGFKSQPLIVKVFYTPAPIAPVEPAPQPELPDTTNEDSIFNPQPAD